MIARIETRLRWLARLVFAGASLLLPLESLAATSDITTALPEADAGGSLEAPRPAVIVSGRAMDLVGTPVSMVPKGTTASNASRGRMPWLGAVSLPSATPFGLGYLSSGFGLRGHPILGGTRLHAGLDFAAPTGSPVLATMDGYVSAAGWAGGYGLSVRLENGSSLETRYGHLSRITVAPGSFVRKGELIGLVGTTGLSTGPHLHYEVRVNGRAVDPRAYLRR